MTAAKRGRKKPKSVFAPIEKAIDAIRDGEMIIVVDDEDRENEGDLTIAAEKITPAAINFMARYGRGLICTPMTEDRLRELDLAEMAPENTARFGTAFTRVDRSQGSHEHRDLGARSRGDGPRGDRPSNAPVRSCASRPHVSAQGAGTAAFSCVPGRPKPRSISHASPAFTRPASSAKS